jgi:hypothetical protein
MTDEQFLESVAKEFEKRLPGRPFLFFCRESEAGVMCTVMTNMDPKGVATLGGELKHLRANPTAESRDLATRTN